MAPSPIEAKLARLRGNIKANLENLPDLPPPKPEPEPIPEPKPEVKVTTNAPVYGPAKPEAKSQPKSAPKPNLSSILWPDAGQSDSDSDDSEADCDMEFIRLVEDEEKIKELEKDDSSDDDDNPAITLATKKASLLKGELAPLGQGFAAVVGFSKFPYKYIHRDHSENVADRFFNAGKFFMREWDLYYIWPLDYSDKPLVLISEEQFVQLIKEVNTQFPSLYINPKDPWFREVGLTLDFNSFKHPRFRPRYLGRCNSKDQYDNMVSQSPSADFTRKSDPVPKMAPDDRSLETFRAIIENSIAANKSKNKASKEVQRLARVEKQKDMSKQLKRAQRYLGVRPRIEKGQDQAAASPDAPAIPAIEYDEPAPYPFEMAPVFVCIDVEAYERSKKIITEIGVATLDTLDLVGVAPGISGKDWQQKIHARHFRIKENTAYRNGNFVADAADQFEFGDSEFISIKDAPAIIASCFKPPFSKPGENNAEVTQNEEKRNIIFVAHDANTDIQFLLQVGYNPMNLSNLLEVLDTGSLYRAHERHPNTTSVGNILYDFGFVGWHLHNAGNDAVYTMWIMLATCVREANARGKTETELERQRKLEADIAASIEKAKEMVLEDHHGWVEGENDNDDDGVAVTV